MLLTLKKQVVETVEVEVKTPAYYIDWIGNYVFIDDETRLIKVNPLMIVIWEPKDGVHFHDALVEVTEKGTPCSKEEFENAYMKVIKKFESVTGVVINS